MIIGIVGKAGAGKDSIADRLVAKHSFRRDSLAAPLKRCVQDIFGISDAFMTDRGLREADLPRWPGWTTRKLLQFVGTELFRQQIHPDVWARSLCYRILRESAEIDWVIPDVRFENEHLVLSTVFGDSYRLWHVVRPGHNGAPSGIPGHASEQWAPSDADAAYLLNSSDLLALAEGVDALLEAERRASRP